AACAAVANVVASPAPQASETATERPTTLSRRREGSSLAKIGKTIGMAVAPVRSTVPLCHHSGRPPHARAPHAGRMTCSGRSPGSRVVILLRLPKLCHTKPSGNLKKDSPPTVAGAAPDLTRRGNGGSHRIPF